MKLKTLAVAAMALLALSSIPADAAATLPGGATSLNEVHADWLVKCQVRTTGTDSATACSILQQQVDKGTNRRVLTLALTPGDDGGIKGTLVMPFGLDLDKGVTLQIDAGPLTPPLHFQTCMPGGCLIQLDWPASTVKALRSATTLKAAGVAVGAQPAPFSISLNGFAGALDRAIELTAAKQ